MSDFDDTDESTETIHARDEAAGVRLDTFLGRRQDVYSRTFFQQLIKDGRVTVNDEMAKPSLVLEGGERIVVRFPPAENPWPHPQNIPVDVVHDDQDIIIVNKAAGMIVHPAAGNPDGTLVNALLWKFPELPGINGVKRPGIVHRLDRETSGVMVVAKNDRAMKSLANQIRVRQMSRLYCALVIGEPDWEETTIDAPIGRHESFRIKRSVGGQGAKDAVTHLRILARLNGFSLLRCELETGRTHQIRVHCSHANLPIAGDETYGGTEHRALEKLQHAESLPRTMLRNLKRPFLHARTLRLRHPESGEWTTFSAPLPQELRVVLDALNAEIDFEALLRNEIG